MLTCCWSPKGGAGTTLVVTALARIAAASSGASLLVDLAGDVPAVLGLPEPDGPGLAEWLAAGVDAPVDALARLEVPTGSGVAVLPRGAGPLDPARAEVLGALLADDRRRTYVDCGADPAGAARSVLLAADRSVLVTRACFLSLRRAAAGGLRPTEVVLVREAGRSLTRHDVAEALGAPVTAEVSVDPAVARAVDAGLLGARLPRGLAKELAGAA